MNFMDKLSYFYIKRIKRNMQCPVCNHTLKFSKVLKSWVCKDCGYSLSEVEFLDDFVLWFCDGCGTYLNVQEGFDRKAKSHICEKCGFDNDTTFDNIKGECKDCGKLLDNPDATICEDCKTIRMEKAKAFLDVAATCCYDLADALDTKEEIGEDF